MPADRAYAKVRSLVEKTIPASFYDLPSATRSERWKEINAAMEETLNYTYIDHKDIERGKLLWKLDQLRELNPQAVWIVEKFIALVREGKDFSTLDYRLEGLQMGYSMEELEWRTCSALIGLITADYSASDQYKRDYGLL